MRIEIPTGVLDQMRREAQAAYPHECCGLLIGSATAEHLTIRQARPASNVADPSRHADRYSVDPRTILEADTAARAAGQDVIGAYHSHPDHPAIPSATDAALSWEGYIYVILSVIQGRVGEIRAWRLTPQQPPEELPLVYSSIR